MGNCATKRANKTYQSSVKVSVPDLSYVNRTDKSLLTVFDQEIKIFKLKRKVKLYKDSVISYLSDGSLIVAGGSDSSGNLTIRAFLIFPSERLIKEISKLPFPIKEGHFVKYIKHIYYVGGIIEAEDGDSLTSEEGSPILRYNIDDNFWEIYKHKNLMLDPSTYLQRKITENECSGQVFTNNITALKHLVEPGVIAFEGRIFLIGGKIFQNGQYEIVDRIFSFSANSENFAIREEEMRLPVKLTRVACSLRRNIGCITGGYTESNTPNTQIFQIDFANNILKKLNTELERPIEDNYPICLDVKGILCFSPPRLLYVREDKNKTYNFVIPSLDPQNNEIKVAEKTQDKPYKKFDANLSISFNNDSTFAEKTHRKFEDIAKENSIFDVSFPESARSQGVSPIKRVDSKMNNSSSEELSPISKARLSISSVRKSTSLTIFCEIHDLISVSDIDKNNITPKCFYQCCYCKKLIENTSWKCRICTILLCNDCGLWSAKAEMVENEKLKCSNSHFFFRSGHDENYFACCYCAKKMNGSRIECRRCGEILCGICEGYIVNFQEYNEFLRCANGHQFEWLQFDSKNQQKVKCNRCQIEIFSIGSFTCRNCQLYYCVNCLPSLGNEEKKQALKSPKAKSVVENAFVTEELKLSSNNSEKVPVIVLRNDTENSSLSSPKFSARKSIGKVSEKQTDHEVEEVYFQRTEKLDQQAFHDSEQEEYLNSGEINIENQVFEASHPEINNFEEESNSEKNSQTAERLSEENASTKWQLKNTKKVKRAIKPRDSSSMSSSGSEFQQKRITSSDSSYYDLVEDSSGKAKRSKKHSSSKVSEKHSATSSKNKHKESSEDSSKLLGSSLKSNDLMFTGSVMGDKNLIAPEIDLSYANDKINELRAKFGSFYSKESFSSDSSESNENGAIMNLENADSSSNFSIEVQDE